MHRKLGILSGCVALMILIFDSACALKSAREALQQCLFTVAPTILPYMVLSAYLTGAVCSMRVGLFRQISKILRIPPGSEGLFLLGFLGGYPSGAQAVDFCCRNGQLSRSDAKRMLPLCSNAGPAFLFGIAAQAFSSPVAGFYLWGILFASAMITGMLFPGRCSQKEIPSSGKTTLPKAVASACKATALVCSWIIFVRIFLSFLQRWVLWLLPKTIEVTLFGLLELATGCISLMEISDEKLRFVLACVMLSFGGICVLMQTASVAPTTGLGYYFPGKVLQALVAGMLGCALCGWVIPCIIFSIGASVMIAFLWIREKKTVAFSEKILYNGGRKRKRGMIYAVPKKD